MEPLPAPIRPLYAGLVEFKKCHNIVPLWTERSVFNLDYGYGGTLDLICEVDGKTVLLDFKTKPSKQKCVVYPEYYMQLAAYRHADFGVDKNLMPEKLPKITGSRILFVYPDGHEFVETNYDDVAFPAFTAQLAAYRLITELQKASKNLTPE